MSRVLTLAHSFLISERFYWLYPLSLLLMLLCGLLCNKQKRGCLKCKFETASLWVLPNVTAPSEQKGRKYSETIVTIRTMRCRSFLPFFSRY